VSQWFGKSWGAPVCDPASHVVTPIGEACLFCDKLIAAHHQGLTLPDAGTGIPRSVHLDCFLRNIGVSTAPSRTDNNDHD